MWPLVKMLAAAAVVGGGVGAFIKTKVDTALRGAGGKEVDSDKIQYVKLPADVKIKQVTIVAEDPNNKLPAKKTENSAG